MCGIFGITAADGRARLGEGAARRVLDALACRGPDDEGWTSHDGVELGHRRLEVMDLSAAGHQPMSNEDGTVWVTYNGEIYRFAALRAELEALGHTFRSRSDTEVLVHGYEAWGRDLLGRIDGMFALAVWDTRRKTLLLARDRLGKKPLFYGTRGGRFAFSSLLKPLVESGVVEPEIDPDALREFLFFGYVISPRTIFRGARQVEPGHWLEVRDGRIEGGAYWSLADVRAEEAGGDPREAEPQARFESLLIDAVRARLVSDAPLGIFLSGGLDSAVVAALAQRESAVPLQTFSVGFEERTWDERPKARTVAARLATVHHEVECTAADVPDVLARVAASADHLLADQSLVPLAKLARETKRSVKVVLTGDGGDELLAGYPTYRALRAAAVYLAVVPRAVRAAAGPRLAAMLPVRSEKMAASMVASRFLHATTSDLATAHASWRTLWSHDEIVSILRRPASTSAAARDVEHEAAPYARRMLDDRGWNLVQRAVYADVSTWLVDSILAKVDRATMAHGLEARSPLLDSRLFEYSFATLLAQPARHGAKKPLRRLARRLLGPEIADVPKEGFQTPFAAWLAGPLRPYVRESLATLRTTFGAAFDHARLDALEHEHAERHRNHDLKLWTLVALAAWSRVFPGLGISSEPPADRAILGS